MLLTPSFLLHVMVLPPVARSFVDLRPSYLRRKDNDGVTPFEWAMNKDIKDLFRACGAQHNAGKE